MRGIAIGGFQRYGIGVVGAAARNAVIESNWLGMTPDGRAAAPNRLSGVAVLGGAADARIGGDCAGCGNRIAGNSVAQRSGHGVVIGGGGVTGARVLGNTIGLNADDQPLPNDDGVLVVDAAQADIVGNVICASAVAGIEFRETRARAAIDGNRIGVSAAGAPAGNDVGVFLGPGAARVRVGAAQANIIAANRVGLAVEQGAREIQLSNNWIGLVPPPGSPTSTSLAEARPLPNRERGISIIAGAAEVRVVANQLLVGRRGIVIAGADTSRVSLQRNVIAGPERSPEQGAIGIEARQAADLRIGGDSGLGNSLRGLDTAILLAEIEEAAVSGNRIGAEFAAVDFPAASDTATGIALGDDVRAATVRENRIGGLSGAAVRVDGANARGNLITRNVFGGNDGLDIDLADHVEAPQTPTLLSYAVERIPNNQLRNTIRGRGEPGAFVEIYVVGLDRPGALARAYVGGDGAFEAQTLVLALGDIRAVGVARGGATSEFSAPLPAPARQPIAPRRSGDDGLRLLAIEGRERPVAEALAVFGQAAIAAWRWDAAAARWQAWSQYAPDSLHALRTVRGGDVLAVTLAPGVPREYFSTEHIEGVGAAIPLQRGLNLLSWTGPWTTAAAALNQLDQEQPGLLSIVEQWDPTEQRWRVIWPTTQGAWQPPNWGAPILRLRATQSITWQQGE